MAIRTLLLSGRSFDPLALSGSVGILALASAAAALVPAIRAARADPVVSLKSE